MRSNKPIRTQGEVSKTVTGSHGLIAFLVAVTVLAMVPGVDTMLVIRNVLQRGRLSGIVTGIGACSGVFVHATFSAIGLSLILTTSAQAYSVVKMAGAAYLAGLGIWTVVAARRADHTHVEPSNTPTAGGRRLGVSYLSGVLSNLLNPKAAVFYLAFLPQFIAPGDPVLAKSLMLAGIHFTVAAVWLSLVALMVGSLSSWLASARAKRRLEYVSGVVIGLLGLRLALGK